MKLNHALAAFSALALAVSAPALTIGGLTFDDDAFADVLLSSSGTYSTSGGSLSSVLTDKDPGTWAFSGTSGAFVQLGFTDNLVVNGPGADLAVFELGVPSVFGVSLTLGGVTQNFATSFTGFAAGGFNLNVALINLDAFGLATNATLDSIVLRMDNSSSTLPSLSLVGALNSGSPRASVPEGGTTFALLGGALLSFIALRRRLAC